RVSGVGPAVAGEEPDPFAEAVSSALGPAFPPTPNTQHPTPNTQPPIPHVDVAAQPLRPIAQLWNSLIAAEGAGGLWIIDQHLAHERVLFERLIAGHDGSGVASQRLAVPTTLALTHRQALALEERLPELATLGFALETFGRDTFVVRAVPAF